MWTSWVHTGLCQPVPEAWARAGGVESDPRQLRVEQPGHTDISSRHWQLCHVWPSHLAPGVPRPSTTGEQPERPRCSGGGQWGRCSEF